MGTGFKILLVVSGIIIIAGLVIIYHGLQGKSGTYEDYPFWNRIKPLEKNEVFRLMPNWFHEAEFCGYYVAKHKGFFKQKKLDIHILNYNRDYRSLDSLRKGIIDFAVISPPELIKAGDDNCDIMVIAAIYQVFPGVYLVMENSDIKSPSDFCGHSIIAKNDVWVDYTRRILENVEHDTSCVDWDLDDIEISRFIDGEVDIWTGYVQDEPIEIEMAGYSVREIYMYDYGFIDYAGLLVTRRGLIEEKPEEVKTFLATCLFGWDYALRNPEDAVDAILEYAPELAIPFQRQAVKRITPFIKNGDAPIGWIDRDRWECMIKELSIENPDSLLYDKFLHELYEGIITENVRLDKP